MTVSTDTARVDYNGDGAQTAFTVTFRFLDESHLKVILVESDGTEVVQTITTHYTVTGTGGDAGTVTMVTAPASGEKLIIKRNIPFTQLTDLQTNGPLPANSLEDMVDQLTMASQQVNERIDRSLHFKESSDLTDVEMDDLVANKVLIVNSSADSVEMGPTADEIAAAQAEATAAAASAAAAAASAALAATVQEELVVAGGTADAITATHTSPVSLADKTRVLVRAIFANTATAPTFAPDGLAAHTVVKEGRIALVAGDIADDQIMSMIYNSANTEWELQNPSNPLDTDATMASAVDTLAPSQLAAKTYADLSRTNTAINGGFKVWQRRTGGAAVSCPVATETYLADRVFVNPAGEAILQIRGDAVRPGSKEKYTLLLSGATSTTTVNIGLQRYEAINIPGIKRSVTISMWVLNGSGADYTPTLLLGTPNAVENYTAVTNRLTQVLGTAVDGVWTELTHVVDISGYTNIDNGLQVELQIPSGSLVVGNTVTIMEFQLEPSTVVTPFESRPYSEELALCKWYYERIVSEVNNQVLGCGYVSSTSDGRIPVNYTEKRIIPTIDISNVTHFGLLNSAGSIASAAGTVFAQIAKKTARFNVTGASSPYTEKNAILATFPTAGTGYIEIKAEL